MDISDNFLKLGGYYYVRLVGKDRLCVDEQDYQRLELVLAEAFAEHGCMAGQAGLLAYCLLPKESRLLVQLDWLEGLGVLLTVVIGAYSAYFCAKYGPECLPFEKQVEVVMVEYGHEAVHLSQMVHASPAVIGSLVATYPWSSFNQYMSGCFAGYMRDWLWQEQKLDQKQYGAMVLQRSKIEDTAYQRRFFGYDEGDSIGQSGVGVTATRFKRKQLTVEQLLDEVMQEGVG